MIILWLASWPLLLVMAIAAWAYAYARGNVNIVDSVWSLFFVMAMLVYTVLAPVIGLTVLVLLLMVVLWGLRLSLHLALRNAGKPEDRRYAAFRARNPAFAVQSLWTVFGLQAALAWLISVPLAATAYTAAPFSLLHLPGVLLFAIGLGWETVADWQLTRFRADPSHRGKVLDTGLWRYSRHPNYFGEACLWWGLYLYSLPGGVSWTVVSPLLMTILLLRVSGVSLLEKGIHERRPGYELYKATTPAFFPWRPRKTTQAGTAPRWNA